MVFFYHRAYGNSRESEVIAIMQYRFIIMIMVGASMQRKGYHRKPENVGDLHLFNDY